MKKTNTKKLFPLALLLFLLVGGSIFYVKNYILNQGMKTYSNTDYGFSLQYPRNWSFYESFRTSEGDNNQGLINIMFGEPSKQKMDFGGKKIDFTSGVVTMYVTGKSSINTIQKIISLKYKDSSYYTKQYGKRNIHFTPSDIKVDGVQGNLLTASNCFYTCKAVFFEKDNRIFEVVLKGGFDHKTENPIKNPLDEKIFNDIIASFRFITPISQAVGWNTYTDPQARFTFQYPQNLSIEGEASTIKFLDKTTGKEKFELSVFNNPTNIDAEDYLINTINNGDFYKSNVHRTAFNGYSALTREEKNVCLSKDPNNCQIYSDDYGMLIQGGGLIVSFLTPITINKDKEAESMVSSEDIVKFYNTMLSTFQFSSK